MKILLNNQTLNRKIRPFDDIGFIPTMGGIHEGHISLIKRSIKLCKKTIVSIFVNPSQFNSKKDFKTYPSNIKKDLSILKKLEVLTLFIFLNLKIFIIIKKIPKLRLKK